MLPEVPAARCGALQVTGTVKIDEFASASDEDDYIFEFLVDGTAADTREQVCGPETWFRQNSPYVLAAPPGSKEEASPFLWHPVSLVLLAMCGHQPFVTLASCMDSRGTHDSPFPLSLSFGVRRMSVAHLMSQGNLRLAPVSLTRHPPWAVQWS